MSDSIAIVVLAAGGSTRLGRPKQLLRFKGRTLLRRATDAAIESRCARVLVVLGASAEACRGELADLSNALQIVENPHWKRGIGGSIRLGVLEAAGGGASAVILMTCDQPHADAGILRQLCSAYRASRPPIVASAYADTLGIPALFDRALFGQLCTLDDHRGAKSVIESAGPGVVGIPFPFGAIDVDTPEDAAQWADPS